jgi:hypothetical protein
LAFKIWMERIDDSGVVRDRHSLHYRFATEKSARLKADDLALPHVNRRYLDDGQFWEFTEADGTVVRIVVEPT